MLAAASLSDGMHARQGGFTIKTQLDQIQQTMNDSGKP